MNYADFSRDAADRQDAGVGMSAIAVTDNNLGGRWQMALTWIKLRRGAAQSRQDLPVKFDSRLEGSFSLDSGQ